MASVNENSCIPHSSCQSNDTSDVQLPSIQGNVPSHLSNKPKLDLIQAILNYQSVCFIISQLTNSVSKLKHNYKVVKPFLEELVTMGLLIKLNDGIKSGKNSSTLFIKVLPPSLTLHAIEQFVTEFLDKVKIPWLLYKESCSKLIMSSSSAKLSEEANSILIAAPYENLIQQRLTAATSAKKSTTTKRKRKEPSPIPPPTTLNSLHRYFPTCSKENVVPSRTINQTISTDDDDCVIISSLSCVQSTSSMPKPSTASSSCSSTTPSYQSSSPPNELVSKYFVNPLLPRPYPRIARIPNTPSIPLEEVEQQQTTTTSTGHKRRRNQ